MFRMSLATIASLWLTLWWIGAVLSCEFKDVQKIAKELEEYNDWEGLAGNMNINPDLIKENCATSIALAECHRRRLVRSIYLESMKNKRIAQNLRQLNFTRGSEGSSRDPPVCVPMDSSHYFTSTTAESLISRYVQYLRDFYSEPFFQNTDRFPFTHTPVYVNLTLVEKIVNHEKLKKQYKGNIDQKLAMKIEMDEILNEDTRFVLIEGAAGMDKSTLAWKICQSWKSNSGLLKSLKRFWLVIFISLLEEEVRLAKDVSDLFYHSDRELAASVGREVEKREGEGVLFVFDGFDEFPAEFRKKSLVIKIIGDPRYFRKATVIVTSRPSALGDLQRFINDERSRHIEIIGFTKTEILEYASQRLALDPRAQSKNFSSYLSLNPAVEGMMYNPLHAAIVLEIYLDLDSPTIYTQTQLYSKLTLCLVSRYLNEMEHPLAKKLPDSLEDLCARTDILCWQLVKIGQIAFEGMCNEQRRFENLPDDFDSLGLLIKRTKIQLWQEPSEFLFFHSTLQEFLSAFYISRLDIEEQRDIFQKYSSMRSVWVFVAGLTKMASIGWGEFTRGPMSNISKADTFTVQCIYEAQDHGCEIDSGSGIEFLEFNPTNYDLFALGYSIRACESTWKIAIKGEVREDGFEMFGRGILSAENHSGGSSPLTIEIETVCTPCNTHIEQLLRMPDQILHSIKALFLLDCLNKNGPIGFGLGALLHECTGSITMCIIKNSQEDISLESLTVPVLKPHVNFTERSLKNTQLTKEHCVLVKQLISLSSLQSLVIQESFNYDICGLDVYESISDNITYLVLVDSLYVQHKCYDTYLSSRPPYVSGLTNILRKKLSLKIVKLCIVMTRDEVNDIVVSLKDNKNLELLELPKMYSFCFPWIEWIDYRVCFVPSPVQSKHTQLIKWEDPRSTIESLVLSLSPNLQMYCLPPSFSGRLQFLSYIPPSLRRWRRT